MKILILHASAGAGHKRAAEALVKAFSSVEPGAVIKICDMLDYTPALFRKTYGSGYLDLVKRAPELWGYMYSESDRKALDPWRRKVRSAVNKINTPKFSLFFRKFNPDVAVCTHFMPLELLSTRIRHGKTNVKLFCPVTDFGVHSLWVVEHVLRYYVATEEGKRQLIRKGQPAGSILITGIPIDPVFMSSESPDKAKQRLGFERNLPLVLVLCGGFGVGPAAQLVASFGEEPLRCNVVVVAGNNRKLKQDVESAAARSRTPVKVLGFVNNIHEFMDASDLVISKPGGLTSSEAMAKGRPMMIIDPIPGQEQRNCEFLLEAGAAARLFEPGDAAWKVKQLLSNPARLAQMGKNAQVLGKPGAAIKIAEDILSLARQA